MKNRKLKFILSLAFFALLNIHGAFAQNDISVFFINGAGLYSGKNITEARLGNNVRIPTGAKINLEPQTEVTLKDNAGRFCIINSAKESLTLSYKQIQREFNKQERKGLLSALYDFMKSELNKKKKNIRDYADYNLAKKGGVTRASCAMPLMINPGFEAKVSVDSATFYWHSDTQASGYIFKLYEGDAFAQNTALIFRTTVTDTFFTVSLTDKIDLEENKVFSWLAYPANDRENCARYEIYFYNTDGLNNRLTNIETKAAEIEDEKERCLYLAGQYEEEGFLEIAKETLETLKQKYPAKVYEDLYLIFLARNGML